MLMERRCSQREKLTRSEQWQSWNNSAQKPIRCIQHSTVSPASRAERSDPAATTVAQSDQSPTAKPSHVRDTTGRWTICVGKHTGTHVRSPRAREPHSEVICDSQHADTVSGHDTASEHVDCSWRCESINPATSTGRDVNTSGVWIPFIDLETRQHKDIAHEELCTTSVAGYTRAETAKGYSQQKGDDLAVRD